MKFINIADVAEVEQKSPQGSYGLWQKDISLALGNRKHVTPFERGHPFDLAQVRVPAGAKNWPVHRHSAPWELYYVLAGAGRYFNGHSWNEIQTGDVILSLPGESHQLENSGQTDLIYLVITDMPLADSVFYPVTGLTFVKPEWKLFTEADANYYDGHE
jgi:uncharacterized cupin superfamily protein